MLAFHNVRKAFRATVAVDGLSLEVRRGEVLGLLGPNGAGKTTSVNLAVGLLAPDQGRVEFAGGSPQQAAVRRRMGVAPQSLAIYDELTGEENVQFFARMHGLRGAPLRQRSAQAIALVGLDDRRRQRAGTYSGGMKRRLNLAAAIAHEPELLILDEPTAGVDPQSRNAIFENIVALRARGVTVIYTTHYMEEAERLCDRVAIVDRGRLLALDTVRGLVAAHGGHSRLHAVTERGEHTIEADDPVAELNRLQASERLLRFELERPSLEAVFLNLTGRTLRD
ncbi:MAG: ABC transporter ATP-binding protein [Phycisphaerae bacterium]|jgi:ABC-2 type transport system ATP-binding protein|nr:ABC transporter ATP-binding protein [Phycisphaerae bacterium]MCZ2401128.1 ABC transporter ATP-binding protein [Phycisphaerae bacterium]NUQ49164.1 ABC transporter ATP-binding protein [Phycisphaerae bacterium]